MDQILATLDSLIKALQYVQAWQDRTDRILLGFAVTHVIEIVGLYYLWGRIARRDRHQ